MSNTDWSKNDEIKKFQEYLRIQSVHPDVDYAPCVQFLLEQAKSLELSVNVYFPDLATKPVPVLTWSGIEPKLPSIMLNSHMDVVPVVEEYWTHPPFAAEIDDQGRIFARGTQDMKSVGMQYLAAVRALKRDGIRLRRTVHIVFTPDEEIGGFSGMGKFVQTDQFKELNVGFCLDEGMASATEEYPVFYGERFSWVIELKSIGKSGHASLFHDDTAVVRMHKLLDKFLLFRESEEKRLHKDEKLTIGDVTTVNLTMINGGVQRNVIPPEITMTISARVAVTMDSEHFEKIISEWCEQAGGSIEVTFPAKSPRVEPTKIDETNVYWVAFQEVLENDLNFKIKPQIFPAATDSRHLRAKNIPVIGFSPMNHTPVLLHEHDEYIKASTYIEGINIYKRLLIKIANV